MANSKGHIFRKTQTGSCNLPSRKKFLVKNDFDLCLDSDDPSSLSTSDSDDRFDFEFFVGGKMSIRNESMMSDENKEYKSKEVPKLLDIAAKETAKYYPCEALETHEPPLDESMLKKVAYWAFPQDEDRVRIYARLCFKNENEWIHGEQLFLDDRIQDIRQVGFMVSAIINKQLSTFCKVTKEDSRVSLTFEKQQITSTKCAMCPQVIWCQHIIGVVMHRIRKAEQVPVHAPVTETLSTLTRDQLQKLLQYAINSDPGGILGRVFKHMDDIRDGTSDLNAVQGAPDPTFGVSSDEPSVWEQSMEQMKKHLKDEIRAGSYRDTSNIRQKKNCGFYDKFLQRIIDLIAKNETEHAGQVLIVIAEYSAFQVLSTEDEPSNTALRLFLDIEKMFCCFIITFKGQARADLINTALDLNRKAKQNVAIYRTPSEWADLASIKLDDVMASTQMNTDGSQDSQKLGVLGAYPNAPFYQAVCASLLQDVPADLQDLYDGKQSLISTTYNEPMPVMLLRFDSFILLNSSQSNAKLCILGSFILSHLLALTEKLSVTGNRKQASTTEDDDGPSKPKRARTSRGKTQRKASHLINEPVVKPIEEDNLLIEGLSKPQLSYCLLYVCYSLYRTEDFSDMDIHQTRVLLNASLRAVELGRYRYIAPPDSIYSEDYSWLHYLESQVQNSYLKLANLGIAGRQVSKMYISVLKEDGYDFYGDNLAVGLISLLEKQDSMDKDTCVQLCVEAICHNSCPLKNLTVPEISYECRYCRSSIVSKWSSLITSVFRISFENITVYKNVITRILKHFETIDDREYVAVAYSVFKVYQMNLTEVEHMVLLVKIVLRCIKLSATEGWAGYHSYAGSSCETLTKLGKQLGIEFPVLVLTVWKELLTFYNSSRLEGIIEVMKDTVCKESTLPAQMTHMLLKYFDSKCKHDEECCELLQFFKVGDKGHVQALKKIAANAENYTPRSLLLMAKRTYEEESAVKGTSAQIYSKEVHQFLNLAFDRIRELKSNCLSATINWSDLSTNNYLIWFFENVAAYGNDAAAKNPQFLNFVDSVSDCMKDDADILLAFLKAMKACPPMLEVAKKIMGMKLVISFQKQFDQDVRSCNHTSYRRILGEMVKARQHCILYVQNGEELFASEVTDFIRKYHRGKKKLIKIMNEDYHDLLKRSDLLR